MVALAASEARFQSRWGDGRTLRAAHNRHARNSESCPVGLTADAAPDSSSRWAWRGFATESLLEQSIQGVCTVSIGLSWFQVSPKRTIERIVLGIFSILGESRGRDGQRHRVPTRHLAGLPAGHLTRHERGDGDLGTERLTIPALICRVGPVWVGLPVRSSGHGDDKAPASISRSGRQIGTPMASAPANASACADASACEVSRR
jgi:hypothetical protein